MPYLHVPTTQTNGETTFFVELQREIVSFFFSKIVKRVEKRVPRKKRLIDSLPYEL